MKKKISDKLERSRNINYCKFQIKGIISHLNRLIGNESMTYGDKIKFKIAHRYMKDSLKHWDLAHYPDRRKGEEE